MAGLAAVTKRIQLFATCAVLTMPPPIAARMAVTIDSISHGRFGVNIISGWQRREYTQMGIWPGAEHYKRRYQYCAEYVTIMKELWATGRSDFKGDFFQMDDCRCLPLPSAQIPIICAAQSDAGTKYAAQHADYNFCASFGENKPTPCGSQRRPAGRGHQGDRPRMRRAGADDGHRRRDRRGGRGEVAALQGRHRPRGARLPRRAGQGRPEHGRLCPAQPARTLGTDKLPTNQGVLVGSYASVARMLDELSQVPGVRGVMLTFDDFVIGMEQFGTRIMPLMRCLEQNQEGGVSGATAPVGDRPAIHVGPRPGRLAARAGPAIAGASRGVAPWLVSWLQVFPLTVVLFVMFALPTVLFLVVSFFDYDRIGIYPAFLLDNYREIFTTPSTCASMSARSSSR